MFVRMNNITGAENIDAGVAYVRDTVIGEVKGQKGFRGLTVSANRTSRELGILSIWDTLADLEASESGVSKLRQQAMKAVGGEISVIIMEQLFAEVVAPQDLEGRALRVVTIKMDPAKVDEHLAFFTSEVVPDMRKRPGFLAVRNMVNRATGQGSVGSVWTDEAARQAGEASAKERQKLAEARGVTIGEASYRTILLSHLV